MEILTEAAKQVPSLVVLVVIVVYFLRYLEKLNESQTARAKQMMEPYEKGYAVLNETIKHLSDEIADSKKVSAKLAQVIMYHDATVKGENPDILGSPKEIMERILG